MQKKSQKMTCLNYVVSRRNLMVDALSCTAGLLSSQFLESEAFDSQTQKRKLVQIFLAGGWDTHLTTDPIVGQRNSGGVYDNLYQTTSADQVPGKNIWLGEGLLPAAKAFSEVPTCFINGIFMEVTAHELASQYVLTGVPSLSRTREHPSFIALQAKKTAEFPAHVLFGESIPLGDTRHDTPLLQVTSIKMLEDMLKGPDMTFARNPQAVFQASQSFLKEFNEIHKSGLSEKENQRLKAWRESGSKVAQIYEKNISKQFKLTPELQNYFGIPENKDWEIEARLAGAAITLSTGLSSYVTVLDTSNYDTHANHHPGHMILLKRFAQALQRFVDKLKVTKDPHHPELFLIDTTTIFIASEFGRTPKRNAGAGTDHWPSGSAILMGNNVKDALVGGVDATDMPLGWEGGTTVGRTTQNAISPAKIGASILASLGSPELGANLSPTVLADIVRF